MNLAYSVSLNSKERTPFAGPHLPQTLERIPLLSGGEFERLEVTLHDDPASLLDTIYPTVIGLHWTEMKLGSLLFSEKKHVKDLESILGVPLTSDQMGYALVRYIRESTPEASGDPDATSVTSDVSEDTLESTDRKTNSSSSINAETDGSSSESLQYSNLQRHLDSSDDPLVQFQKRFFAPQHERLLGILRRSSLDAISMKTVSMFSVRDVIDQSKDFHAKDDYFLGGKSVVTHRDEVDIKLCTGMVNVPETSTTELLESLPYQLQDDLKGLHTLRPWTGVLTMPEAKACASIIKRYGTHVLHNVVFGDVIFQVFVFDQETFAQIKELEQDLTVERFVMFSIPNLAEGFGFVKQYGKLLSMANSKQLFVDIANGKWNDATISQVDSILTPVIEGKSIKKFLAKYKQTTLICSSLVPLGTFLNDSQSPYWNIVNSAFLADSQFKKLERYSRINFAPIRFLKQHLLQQTSLVFRCPVTVVHDEYTILSELFHDEESGTVIDFTDEQGSVVELNIFSCVVVISGEKPIVLPGKRINIVCSCMLGSVADGMAPKLVLQDADMENFHFHASSIQGIFYVEDATGKQILISGEVEFRTVSSDRCNDVWSLEVLSSSRRETTEMVDAPLTLQHVKWFLPKLLLLLYDNSSSSCQSASDFINWLFSIFEKITDSDESIDVKREMLYLTYIMPSIVNCPPYVPCQNYSKLLSSTECLQKEADSILSLLRKSECDDKGQTREEQEFHIRRKMKSVIHILEEKLQNFVELYTNFVNLAFMDKVTEIEFKTSLDTNVNESKTRWLECVNKFREILPANVKDSEVAYLLCIFETLANSNSCLPEKPKNMSPAIVQIYDRISSLLITLNVFAHLESSRDDQKDVVTNHTIEKVLEELLNNESGLTCSINVKYLIDLFNQILEEVPNTAEKFEIQHSTTCLIYCIQEILTHAIQRESFFHIIYFIRRYENIISVSTDAAAKYDVGTLASHLVCLSRLVCTILLKVVNVQNTLLQLQVGHSHVLPNMNLDTIKTAVVLNNEAIREMADDPSEGFQSPVFYTAGGIPGEIFEQGSPAVITVEPHACEFANQSNVKLTKIGIQIEGINSKQTDMCEVRLCFDGQEFLQLYETGRVQSFQTSSLEWTIKCDMIGEDTALTPNLLPFDDSLFLLTPFATWRVYFPDSIANEGISFKSSVSITLIFDGMASHTSASKDTENNDSHMRHFPETQALKSINSAGSVMGSWDYAMTFNLNQVNEAIKKQYDNADQKPNLLREILTQRLTFKLSALQARLTWNLQLSYPRVFALHGNRECLGVQIEILGGTFEYGVVKATGKYTAVVEPIRAPKGAVIEGTVPMVFRSHPDNKISVCLCLQQGTFWTKDLKVQTPTDVDFNGILTKYMKKHVNRDMYELVCIRNHSEKLPEVSAQASVSAQGREILQILTSKRFHSNFGVCLKTVLPSPYECSLLVNARLFFHQYLSAAFNKHRRLSVANAKHKSSNHNWSGEVSYGELVIKPESSILRPLESALETKRQAGISLVRAGMIRIPLSRMIFKPTATEGLQFSHTVGAQESITLKVVEASGKETTAFADLFLNLDGGIGTTVRQVDGAAHVDMQIVSKKVTLKAALALNAQGEDHSLDDVVEDMRLKISHEITRALKFDAVPVISDVHISLGGNLEADYKTVYVPGDFVTFGVIDSNKHRVFSPCL